MSVKSKKKSSKESIQNEYKEIKLRISKSIPLVEYIDPNFLQLMINHMIFAHHKYHMEAKKKLTYLHKNNLHDQINAIGNMYKRLDLYGETGNTEWLVDAANCIMIEFMFPSHKKAHFRPTSSEESPGIGE